MDDEDTHRIKAALENVDSRIDEILSHDLPNSNLYRSLKARLKQESDAVRSSPERLDSTPQELEDHVHRVSCVKKTTKELEDFRQQSLTDDSTYQELRVRSRILKVCYFELLRRGVFYYDEMEELAGYPERRGYKRAEDMNHYEFREAVQWAAAHPGEWQQPTLPAETEPDRHRDYESASDSGVEL